MSMAKGGEAEGGQREGRTLSTAAAATPLPRDVLSSSLAAAAAAAVVAAAAATSSSSSSAATARDRHDDIVW